MKRTLASLLLAGTVALGVGAGSPAFAHGPGEGNTGMTGNGYPMGMMGNSGTGNTGGYGPGMMNGYGPGMMGNGYGPGMMGNGYGPGMMGGNGQTMMNGYGPGMMNANGVPCAGTGAAMAKPLTEGDVKQNLERRLEWMGNPRLKVGKVTTKDGHIIADIVTKDGSLVDRFSVEPETGSMQRSE